MEPENENRVVKPAHGHPTIATIAADLGLSRATVTHVLNGRATQQRIRPDTQQRVLAKAEELGYRPNASARAIRAGRFGSVALIQSLLGQYLPAELLAGLAEGIAAHDLRLVLTQVPDVDRSGEAYVARAIRELSVDGLFVNRHGGAPPVYLERIRELRIPAVFLNSKQEADAIYPDDLMGGRLAVEFLMRLGHRRVAFVETDSRPLPHYSEHDRCVGYQRAMAEAGLVAQVHRLPMGWRGGSGQTDDQRVAAAVRLLQGPERPTAVIAYELAESMAVIHAALALGIRIPAELSLLHFHSRIDDRWFLPLHTVSNAMVEVGRSAVAMLHDKIERPDQPIASRAVPEVLLEGASCLPLRS